MAHGCVASARDVERVDGGYRCIGEVRRMDNGQVIATAEGFLGDDEPMWAKRPEYARRAMCQTRSISRACRSAFAHVVVLMDAGLETVPAEEVPQEGFAEHRNGNGHAPRLIDEPAVEIIQPRIVSRELVSGKTTYAEPAPKKKPVAAPNDGSEMTEATFLGVEEKHGTGKKGDWTVWKATLEINGRKLYPSTFEADLGAVLRDCEEGDTVMVRLSERPYTDRNGEQKKGYDLVFVTKLNVPAKAEDSEKDIEWGNGSDDSEQVPF